MTIVNIATHLKDMARRQPEQVALRFPTLRRSAGQTVYTSLSYQELDWISDVLADGLKQCGIGREARVVLMVPPSLEFFALTFALFKAGSVSVFVDPGMGVANIGKCLTEAQPDAFIGIPKAHVARWLIGWGKASLKHCIAVGSGSRWCRWLGKNVRTWDVCRLLTVGGIDRQLPAELKAAAARCGDVSQPSKVETRVASTTSEETAAILFTSGSTGVPKGAVYSHGNFAAQIDMLRQAFSIQPGEIDLCTFPLFALFAPALGMTAIVPRMDFTRPANVDPREVANPIQQFGVANLFGSPALLNRVGRYFTGNPVQWPTIRRVLSAGAPVSAEIIERFAAHLSSGSQIFTPYGATESLPVAVIGSDEILRETRQRTAEGAGTCVGRPVEGMRVSVIAITDTSIAKWDESLVLPQGQIGEIVVDGLNVTQQYFNRPDLTALAKIHDPMTGRMRHRMGDLGYVDDQGRLWFCGRKSHRVITPDRTYFTEPVEGVFNAHPGVFRSALVGVTRSIIRPVGSEAFDRGNRICECLILGRERYNVVQPVLCVELEAGQRVESTKALTAELLTLASKYEHTRAIQLILYHPAFPVDIRHNSKIFREKLAVWAAARLRSAAGS